jgi:hypothetical protein
MACLLLPIRIVIAEAAAPAWQALPFDGQFSAWKQPSGAWYTTDAASLDTGKNRFLQENNGMGGIAINGPEGKAPDLISTAVYGDCEIHVEFMIARKSNSGIYVMGEYEVQIYDSFGVAKDQYPGIECGGIYPQWIANRNQNGHSPIVNATKPFGEWQSFDIVFQAPRFDDSGKKTANAKFVKIIHNGKTIHENVEVSGPTRGGIELEKTTGPLRLQGDHGPVAYRNVRIRPKTAGTHTVFAGKPTNRPQARALVWKKSDTTLALCNGDKTVWQLVFDPQQPKIYFHPLATLDGEILTALSPADHPWHRGLWWSWKYINGLNYWEEDKKTGKSEGVNELTGATVEAHADYSASAVLKFSYHPPGQPAVMTETRTLTMSAPTIDGSYTIDWNSAFTVGDQPVKLERTPPTKAKNGVAWGGYAGLSLRFPPKIKGWSFLTSEGAKSAAEGNGNTTIWADFCGPVAGIAVFDHPANLRHPVPWYLNEEHPYFSPALSYKETLELAPRQALDLKYRIVIHPASTGAAELGKISKEFAK